jgi:carbon storage regulator
MLVLTRREGEEIVIRGDIRLMIVEVTGQRVRLGITAPPSVHVAREEVLARGRDSLLAKNACEQPAPNNPPDP